MFLSIYIFCLTQSQSIIMGCTQSTKSVAETKSPANPPAANNQNGNENDGPKEVNFKPIHSAVRWNKSTEEVEALLNCKEAVEAVDPTNGNRPIHIAAQNGHNDLVKLLIKKKVEIDAQNMKGNTALHMAVGYDYFDTSMLLINAGANAEMVNELNIACKYGLEGDKSLGVAQLVSSSTHADVVSAFAKVEADLEKQNKVSFAQAGLKAKKALGEAWTPDLQDKFKEITGKLT